MSFLINKLYSDDARNSNLVMKITLSHKYRQTEDIIYGRNIQTTVPEIAGDINIYHLTASSYHKDIGK